MRKIPQLAELAITRSRALPRWNRSPNTHPSMDRPYKYFASGALKRTDVNSGARGRPSTSGNCTRAVYCDKVNKYSKAPLINSKIAQHMSAAHRIIIVRSCSGPKVTTAKGEIKRKPKTSRQKGWKKKQKKTNMTIAKVKKIKSRLEPGSRRARIPNAIKYGA